MNDQEELVDQIVQNLAFEVEAVPTKNLVRSPSITQSTPLNVKIKVRKKDEIHTQRNLSSDAVDSSRALQKVRLVNSDRTIMTFDVFMEAEFAKKREKKLHKHIFNMLRPGICLGTVDDDEYPYMPSSSYSANITEPSTATRSDGTLKQTFTLSKNAYQTYTVSNQSRDQKWLFGKCRPGGCLDPPFSEDKYSYKPSTKSGPEQREEEQVENQDVKSQVYNNLIPVTVRNEEVQSNGRQSSIFDSGLFKKKRKSSDKSTNTKLPDKTDSIVDIYQVESVSNSVSIHSNSIITYPPDIKSDPRSSQDKTVKSREPSEEKSRKSFNEHSEPLFVRPKGVNLLKEKGTLNPIDYPKQRSSDATDLSNSLKDPFKMPVPLPIPIPIPLRSDKRKSEKMSKNDDILETQGYNAYVTELDSLPDEELQEEIKDTETPPLDVSAKTSADKIKDKPEKSSNMATFTPSKVEEPTIPNEIDKQDLYRAKLKPVQEIDSENNIKGTAQLNKKSEIQPLRMALPLPVPFSSNEPNMASTEESKPINDNLQISAIKLPQPEQPIETKRPPSPPNTQNNKEDDAIPNFPSTRSSLSDQITDTENPVVPIMTKNIKRDSNGKQITEIIKKPATQNDIKDNDTTATKYPKYLRTRENLSDQINDTENSASKASIENDGKDKDLTAPKYIKENSNVYEIPDTYQIIGSPTKDEKKDSQRISISKLPVLQKSMSLLSESKTPAALLKDKTKRNNSADKHLYNLDYGDIDLDDYKDEKHTSSPSRPDAVNGKSLDPRHDKKDAGEPSKSNKIGFNTESQTRFIKEGNMNVITAPVFVDNSKLTPNLESQVKKVYSETKSFGNSIIGHEIDPSGVPLISQTPSKIRKFDEDGEIHSTLSRELIGNKSVIYDEDGLIPSISSKKSTERSAPSDKRVTQSIDTALSSIQSTSTLKSALKKDTILVDLGFHSYLNDKNERILQTFDTRNAPKRSPNDSVTVLKSQIRISSTEIRIPVDSEHDMSIQIKKSNANQRVSISESGFGNVIDNSRVKKRSPVQCSDDKMRSSETKANENIHESGGSENATSGNLIDYYEHELVPLQSVIKNLRDEIDVLAKQQLIFKDKLFCSSKSKLPRLVHSNKKCFGCVRK